jgi:hypothetical protein
MNVADDATRDSSSCDFSPEGNWISGPCFLLAEKENWPLEPTPYTTTNDDEELELRPTLSISLSKCTLPIPDLCRFSKWLRLVRATAWMLKFIKRVRGKQRDGMTEQGELTVVVMEEAELMWIRQCQWESFPDVMRSVFWKLPLPSSSRLLQLSPSLDDKGVVILRGRLDNLPEWIRCAKQPFILDGRHPYTQLLVAHYHTKMGHLGRGAVVNELRQQYWIVGVRAVVKKTRLQCQYCKNRRAKAIPPEIGQLPVGRLEVCTRPFTNTGMDYFGPMAVTAGRSRQKRYGALFTCLSSRAVHVEIAHSLDTDSAIMAIRRFAARRGIPEKIFADNGTNFHGAEQELKECLEQYNQQKITQDGQVRVVEVKTASGTSSAQQSRSSS